MTSLDTRQLTAEPLDEVSEDTITRRSEAAGEPSWLLDTRLAAFKRFRDQDWPDSHLDEYWRSTPFKRFDVTMPLVIDGPDETRHPRGEDGEIHVPVGLAASGEWDCLMRVVDGRVLDATIGDACVSERVTFGGLVEAAQVVPDRVREVLGSLTTINRDGTGADEDRTITVNDAAWTVGGFVDIPDGVEVAKPIGIHFHMTTAGAHLPRVLIRVGKHAKATIYLEHTSGNGAERMLVDEVVEAVLDEGAQLDIVSLQEWDDDVVDHLSLQKSSVGRDATLRHLSVNIGGRTLRIRPEVDLVGKGASCFPRGVYFADDGQHFDLQPYIRHIAPNATSDVLFKGALQGRCRTIFRGNVLVGKDAVGTNTNETNRSLILTDGARADSTPFLEILCADITASHGSATGQIDARHLFYLESRGIPRTEALRLIVYGFFREVLDKMDLPGVRERAMAHIEREVDSADLESVGVSDALLLAQDE